jgi:TPR repeat protein
MTKKPTGGTGAGRSWGIKTCRSRLLGGISTAKAFRKTNAAFRWYLAAANGGNSYAYLATAQMYAAGKGTERDLVEAYAQLEIALKVLSISETQYLKEARALQGQLAQELSPEQIREAHRRAHKRRPDMVPQ